MIPISRLLRSGRRARVLAAIIVLQALCAAFFIYDIVKDMFETGRLDMAHLVVEGVATVALATGIVYLSKELRAMLDQVDRMESGLRAARGEMVALIQDYFDRWGLSAAEREVAMLVLKGFDNEGIAALRATAKGTVRAQTSAVYAKAGVEGRAQLISFFLEELLADSTSDLRKAG